MTFEENVTKVCDEIKNLLITKNAAYGNSALDPVRIFSKASTTEQILVRIDDKLSRIRTSGLATAGIISEDTVMDLIGYLILLRVSQEKTVADDIIAKVKEQNDALVEKLAWNVSPVPNTVPHTFIANHFENGY